MTTSPVNPIKRKRRPSSFLLWAPLVEILIVVMFLTSLYERAWSRTYAAEVRQALGQVARSSSATFALRAELTRRYQQEAFEALGYQTPAREYIIAPALSSVEGSYRQ